MRRGIERMIATHPGNPGGTTDSTDVEERQLSCETQASEIFRVGMSVDDAGLLKHFGKRAARRGGAVPNSVVRMFADWQRMLVETQYRPPGSVGIPRQYMWADGRMHPPYLHLRCPRQRFLLADTEPFQLDNRRGWR